MNERIVVAVVLAFASAGCSSLFGIGDLPSSQDPAASNDDGGAGGNDGAKPGAQGAEAGNATVSGDGDPRWPQWHMPPDVPPAASFTFENGPDGAMATDTATGLIWQNVVEKKQRNFAAATSYCDALVYDGKDDWRLPTRIELVSIMSFASDGVRLQASAMGDVGDDAPDYWTSSIGQASAPDFAHWIASIGGFRRTNEGDMAYARCVRGPVLGTHHARAYQVDATTVADSLTGLVWERTPPAGTLSWEAADARCKAMTLRGAAARLPTIKEHASIVDDTRESPALDPSFGTTSGRAAWTSTLTQQYRWVVDVVSGEAMNVNMLGDSASRCVAEP